MFEYKTKSHTKPNDIYLVNNTEVDGWELFQIVPECSRFDGSQVCYHYWFRRPVYPKTSTRPVVSRQRVTC